MKTTFTSLLLLAAVLTYANNEDLKKNFVLENPNIQSINAITFGPEGILFIGDSKSACIALDEVMVSQLYPLLKY